MPSSDSKSPSIQPRDRRADILQAAVELFSERGYQGATTDEIAERAGVTKRTLYNHMGSKNHILYEIHRAFIARGLRRWEDVAAAGHGPAETVRTLIREHLAIVIEYHLAIRVFFEESKHLDPEERAVISRQRDEYEAIFRDALKTAVDAGEIRPLDPEVSTRTILSMLTGVYRWYRPTVGLPANELTALIETYLMDGIAEPDVLAIT